jgi:excisionase family DNA binding protein
MEPSEKLLFTRAEAAGMLSLSVSTLDVAIARGMLRARRNGRRVMIEKREIERFSRADHPRIWAPDGNRGTIVSGRECFDCAKNEFVQETPDGYRPIPAVRFFKRLPLCQGCFDERTAALKPLESLVETHA